MTGPPEGRQRLFFALWPEAEARRALERLQAGPLAGLGRPVAAPRIHLTLLFLGPVEDHRAPCLEAGAGAISEAPFTMDLETLGGWSRSGVAWAAPVTTPEPLRRLAAALRAVAADCGLTPEARPFAAHVTLARRVRRPPRRQGVAPIPWPVREFTLVASRTLPTGAEYRVLGRWPLA